MTHPARTVDVEELLASASWIRALARSVVGDAHLAEDVAQEAMLAALAGRRRPGVPLRYWLARVARNLSLNSLRAERRRTPDEREFPAAAPVASPEEIVARTEMFDALVHAVLALEPPYRDVVLLRFFEGMEVGEVAARLRISDEGVRTRLKRALASLRARLDRRYGDRSAWALLALGRPCGPDGPGSLVPGPRSATTGSAALIGGAVVAKKTAVTLAILTLLAASLWVGFGTAERAHPEPAAAPTPPRLAPRAATRRSRVIESIPEPAVASPTAVPVPDPALCVVVDASDRPISGARLSADRPSQYLVPEAAAGPTATSDESGQVRWPPGTPLPDQVLVVAAGQLPRSLTLQELAASGGTPPRVRLDGGMRVAGKVVDPAGRPLAGVEVEARGRFGTDLLMARGALATSRTAGDLQTTISREDGTFELHGVRSLPVVIEAHRAHYVRYGRPPVAATLDTPVVVTLDPLCRLGVSAVDSRTGEPLQHFSALWSGANGLDAGGYGSRSRPSGVPRDGWDEGTRTCWFTFRAPGPMPAGWMPPPLSVKVSAVGYQSASVELPPRWPSDPAFLKPTVVKLEAEFSPGDLGTLAIRCKCECLGERLARITAFVTPRGGPTEWPMLLRRDADGTARVRLPAGRYDVRFGAPPGWSTYSAARDVREISVRAGEESVLDYEIDAGLVALRVNDAAGVAIPAFSVQFMEKGKFAVLSTESLEDDAFTDFRESLAGGAGAIQIPLRPGDHTLVISKPGFVLKTERVTVVAGRVAEVSVVLAEQ